MIFAGPNVYAHMYLDAVEILVPNTPSYEASLQRNRDGSNYFLTKFNNNWVFYYREWFTNFHQMRRSAYFSGSSSICVFEVCFQNLPLIL